MRDRRVFGFTLLELVVSLTIIGLLAAIALPRLANTKERSYITAMTSDLRNLSTHEESHFYDTRVYTPDLNQLQSRGYQSTQMVSVAIVEATSSGWSAVASHSLTAVRCALFVGSAAPAGAATREGVIACN